MYNERKTTGEKSPKKKTTNLFSFYKILFYSIVILQMSNKQKPNFCKDIYLCYFSLKEGSKTEYVCKCGKQRIASNG